MLRLLLAGALGALLLCSSPLSAQTTPDVMQGRMRGAWDLPAGDQPGRVRGVLGHLGQVVAGMEARLTPMPMLGNARGGRIDGILRRRTADGFAPEAFAEVHGTWVVGPDRKGSFEALILPLPVKDVRPEPIGKMAGTFADPVLRRVDTVGSFEGRWALVL